MGGCQNYGPFSGGTLNIRCRIILGRQKGTVILAIRHMGSIGFFKDIQIQGCIRVFQG